MREVISLHLGQAGVQVGSTCWELYCQEHELDPTGSLISAPSTENKASDDGTQSMNVVHEFGDVKRDPSDGFTSFFQEMSSGNFSPLAMLIDLEPSVVDQVRTGPFKKLYSPSNLVTGTEDAANNYGRGAKTVGKKMLKYAMDPLRKMAEGCDRLQGFMLFHSFGGGTGSGFNAILNEELSQEFTKKSKLEISIFPSPTMSTTVVEPYNAILNTHATIDHTDCVFLADNEALYDICQNRLDIDSPNYRNLNSILAVNVSSITASLRFKGTLNTDFTDFQTNLVPYPRIHFPIMGYAPIVNSAKVSHESLSVADLTIQAFHPMNRLQKCNNESGLYIACCLLYRGDVTPKDVNMAIAQVKSKKNMNFVTWSPTGFKVGINQQTPGHLYDSPIAPVTKAVCMLSNTTAVQDAWSNVIIKYFRMLEKRAFLHWYLAEGMEEEYFYEAMDDVAALEEDYTTITLK